MEKNSNVVLRYGAFICVHIEDVDKFRKLIWTFSSANEEGEGLVSYLWHDSIPDELSDMMRTYFIIDENTEELVGYFSLKAGMVSVNERGLFKRTFDSVPGIELANFAVNGSYKTNHPEAKNLGEIILSYFIYPIVKDVAIKIGIKMLYLFSLPRERLISHYEALGFHRLPKREERYVHRRVKPRYDQNCIFMYHILAN